MNNNILTFFSLLIVSIFIFRCSTTENFVVLHQEVSGPAKTNCYLLYEKISNEAALQDVGGPKEYLENDIKKKNINKKYTAYNE